MTNVEIYCVFNIHNLNGDIIPKYGLIIRFDADRCDSWYGICVSHDE
jgi:hypothetical protein